MGLQDTACKKCNGKSFFIDCRGNNTGLYCGDCGAWQKWINKNEINAWKHYFDELDKTLTSKEEKEIDEMVQDFIDESNESTGTELYEQTLMPERLSRLIQWVNEELEKEHKEPHLSNSDFTRSLSYCFGLSKIKAGIENILAGREFDSYGE